MWTTGSLYTRILICLAALAVPQQGLPAATCACCSGLSLADSDCCSSQDNSTTCCCTGASLCHCAETASDNDSLSACCIDSHDEESSGCSCETDCHCGESDAPGLPLVPVSGQKTPTEQLTAASHSTLTSACFTQPEPAERPGCVSISQPASARCASLCRFTL